MSKLNAPYYFAHIPKTGGTSFIALLDHYFDADNICPHQLWWDVGSIKETKNKNYQLYRGHFGGAAQFLSKQKLNYLTILRDPISLAASTYHYSKRDKNTKLHTFINNNDLSFETFIEHRRTSHLVKNRMVRALSFGLDNPLNFDDMNLNPDTFRQFKRKVNLSRAYKTPEERLIRLKQFILNCKWFGILEQYEQSIDLLCYVMGWPPVTKFQKLNVHNRAQEVAPEISERLQALNQFDSRLYNFAQREFEQRYNRMLVEMSLSKNACHKDIKKAIDERYQKNQSGIQVKKQFTPKQPIIGDQWHRREWNPESKKYFCWSGPGENSFIDIWVQPKNYILKIKIINIISPSLIKNLKISINDKQLKWSIESNGSIHNLIIQCDKEMITDAGLIRIHFMYQDIKAHKEVFGGDDHRRVGLALESILIKVAESF